MITVSKVKTNIFFIVFLFISTNIRIQNEVNMTIVLNSMNGIIGELQDDEEILKLNFDQWFPNFQK